MKRFKLYESPQVVELSMAPPNVIAGSPTFAVETGGGSQPATEDNDFDKDFDSFDDTANAKETFTNTLFHSWP